MRTLFPLAVLGLILLALPGGLVFLADLAGRGDDLNGWLEGEFGLSHRLALGLPAAAALFAVIPLLVLLYFLRLKRAPVVVPSTFLWKKSIEDHHVNHWMQWVRRNILLLLQLLAVLAFLYTVLGPRLHGALSGGRYYILMIDQSASMSATDVAPSRLAWAQEQALREIDAATDADTGMVIAFSDTAEIRQSYTTDRAALRAAVRGIEPTQRRTHLEEALNLAASLANPARSTLNEAVAPANPEPGKERTYVAPEGLAATIFLYSDGRFPPVPDFALANLNLVPRFPPVPETAKVSATAPRGSANNVSIVRFEAERDAERPNVVVARASVRNSRGVAAAVRARVQVLANGNRLLASYDDDETRRSGQKLTLPPQAEKPDLVYTIPEVPENTDTVLQLTLEGAEDHFPWDDRAWIVLGVVRKARVLVVGPENRLLRYFFDGSDTRSIAEVSYLPATVLAPGADPKSYRQPAREGAYDWVVFDRCAPTAELEPAANTLYIGELPPTVAGLNPGAGTRVRGPSVRGWNSRHPLMRNLQALDEVDVAEALRVSQWPARTARLLEGSENWLLLAACPREAYTDLVLTFPLLTNDNRWNTNWPLKISFPLFLRNATQQLGNVRDAGSDPPLLPGQVQLLRIGAVPRLELTRPSGETLSIERGNKTEFLIANTDQLGVYTARWTEPNQDTRSRRFAVNLLDPLESDLTIEETVTVGNQSFRGEEPRPAPRDLWKIPLVLGFLVLLLEWWVYNRRVQL